MASWNDEQDTLLKKLWLDGHSASRISLRFPGKSRNAVIGRLHRLGLKGRGSPIVKKPAPPRKSSFNGPRRADAPQRAAPPPRTKSAALFRLELAAEPFVPSQEELNIPVEERRTIATMTDKDCRWPIGDPQRPEFHFCNRHKVPGLPYCEFHARRAFQPPQPRRRDVQAPVVVKPKQVEEV
jgi:GcrA cell cycle regulator